MQIPTKPGQLSVRNQMMWMTGYNEGDDETRYGLSASYGIAPMHQLLLEIRSVDLGDGRVTGNGDVHLGWHWQLVKEQEWIPAFALRNYVRIPSGYHSSGVDYELRGLFSKALTDSARLHFQPFLESINGTNTEHVRHFQWGASIGTDWLVNEDLDVVVDYVYESANTTGVRDQHSCDVGLIYEVAPHHKLGFSFRAGLDGDGVNGDWGAGVFYTIAVDGLPWIGQ